MPFSLPWTDVAPSRQQPLTLQGYWLTRARRAADDWHLPMVVVVEDAIVGVHAMMATSFAAPRAVSTAP